MATVGASAIHGQDNRGLTPLGEAAWRLGLTREQLLRRLQAGRVPGELRGGRWYVDLAAVPEFAGAAK